MRQENSEFKAIKEDKNIFKVAICFSISFVCSVIAVVVGVVFIYYFTIQAERENVKLNVRLDKFTYCLQNVMSEASKSGKFLEPEKAKEICKGFEN